MAAFSTHSGNIVVLDQANIDTDQIIPKQFLTSVSKKGYGKHLFHDWRYLDDAGTKVDPTFVLNHPHHKNASILMTRENFGCGSSREHAPWALTDYGFRAIIAPSYADIFYGNCMNNQLLPIILSNDVIDRIIDTGCESLILDLPQQTVSFGDECVAFDIDPVSKQKLVLGLDAIGQTLLLSDDIKKYEDNMPHWRQ